MNHLAVLRCKIVYVRKRHMYVCRVKELRGQEKREVLKHIPVRKWMRRV